MGNKQKVKRRFEIKYTHNNVKCHRLVFQLKYKDYLINNFYLSQYVTKKSNLLKYKDKKIESKTKKI